MPPVYGGGGEKCRICCKTVYAAEMVTANDWTFHKLCFRCTACNQKLGTDWCVDSSTNNMYCKPHFLQLVKTTGVVAEKDDARSRRSSSSTQQPNEEPPSSLPPADKAAAPESAAAVQTPSVPTVAASGHKLKSRTLSFGGGGGEKCHRCRKTVYVAERAQAQGNVFHKLCFTCTECNSKLGPNNWCVDTGGNLYCKPHFTQLLKSGGGNYNISGGSRPSDSKYAAVDSAGQSGASTLPSATRTRSTSGGGMVSRLVNSAHEKLSAVTSGVVSQQMQVAVEKPASRKELTPATPSAVVLGSSQDEQGEGSSPSSGSNPSPPPAALDAAQPAATGEQRVKKRVVEMSGRRRKPKQHAKPGEPTSATEQVEQAS